MQNQITSCFHPEELLTAAEENVTFLILMCQALLELDLIASLVFCPTFCLLYSMIQPHWPLSLLPQGLCTCCSCFCTSLHLLPWPPERHSWTFPA